MVDEVKKIEFKSPWTMIQFEDVDMWINLVKNALKPSDPLFKKDIYVSGRHEYNKLLLVDNDTDDNYAIVSVGFNQNSQKYICSTVELISSTKELANKLQHDYEVELKQLLNDD